MSTSLELRHLRYFVLVAEELHFGRAAERLGIAQPPLSQQIRQLEERMGVRLLDRTTRSVRLTRAGEVFLEKARVALDSVTDAIDTTREEAATFSGDLAIGAVYPAIRQLLPRAIRRYHGRFPKVRLSVSMMTTGRQIEKLVAGELQVGFIRPPLSPGPLHVQHISTEGFGLIMRRGHALADKPGLGLVDLADEPFLAYASIVGASYQSLAFRACREFGYRPRIVAETDDTLSMATLCSAGIGVAVVPEWVRLIAMPDLVFRPLPELPRAIGMAVATIGDRPPRQIQSFVETVRGMTDAM